jgi:cysteine desulfurase
MRDPIYLDYNATTPIDSTALDAMLPYLRTHFGNPSSDHVYGYRAREAVATAREQLAALLGAHPDEVIFTGGGSEANNLALFGLAATRRARGNHIITSTIEHPAVREPFRALERQGYRVTEVPVEQDGRVDPAQVVAALSAETILVSIMHANNEVGTIQDLRAIADLAHARDVLVHTDAAQSVGKVPVRMDALGVDLLTVAGHKLYAPKGVGALIVRRGIALEPHLRGAGHEHGLRAGTENVPYLVGLGQAAELVGARLDTYQERTRQLRDMLHEAIRASVADVVLNGHPTERLPNTLNVSFPGVNAAALLARIRDQVACSTGSACHAGHAEPSRVLLAMGREPALAAGALRLSLGWSTTEADVQEAAAVIAAAAQGERR